MTTNHPTDLDIRVDDLGGAAIQSLIRAHLDHMAEVTPAGSIYALDLTGLAAPEVTFWSVWSGDALVGCGALKEIDPKHGEIKSMHTAAAHRGRGVGRRMLGHILAEARRRGYHRLSLETGGSPAFQPALTLYKNRGFVKTGPFDDYAFDPHSVYLTLPLV